MSLRAHLVHTYCSLDPRSVGLFRILFAGVLLCDLYLRYRGLDSSFFMASTRVQAQVGMALCTVAFIGLAVGYRTRLMQLVSLLMLSSSAPACLRENVAYVVLEQLAIWTSFLPLGLRFSLDALRASLRARPEHSAEELLDRAALQGPVQPVVSIAVPALILQLMVGLILGPWSFTMLLFVVLFAHPRYWNAVHRSLKERGNHLTCFFDSDCGVCFLTVRVLARLDALERIRFVPNHEHDQLPPGVSQDLVQRTVVVVDDVTREISTRSDAAAEICRVLPFGYLPWAVLKTPGLRAVWLRLYDLVAENRAAISQWLGLAACGVPAPIGLASSQTEERGRPRKRVERWLNEALVATILVAAVGETLANADAVPAWLRSRQPEALRVTGFGMLSQGLRVFAPGAFVQPNCRSDSDLGRDRAPGSARDRSR